MANEKKKIIHFRLKIQSMNQLPMLTTILVVDLNLVKTRNFLF